MTWPSFIYTGHLLTKICPQNWLMPRVFFSGVSYIILSFDLNSCPVGELEETTRTPSYYVDEGYPAGPVTSLWMKQSMWLRIVHSGDWCLRWCYTLLMMLATKEENKKKKIRRRSVIFDIRVRQSARMSKITLLLIFFFCINHH